MDTVPAWLELDGPAPATAPALWSAVEHAIASADVPDALVERAALFGLPVARVGEVRAPDGDGVTRVRLGEAAASERGAEGLLVVDLSSLWAGPLCGDLLAGAGARVVKVESLTRPDGARRGPAAFFDLLNGRKRSVALDFASGAEVDVLRQLMRKADVVIEASRPRALEQLGISAMECVREGGPRVWVSITGYGRASDRVAFGDDAAAAGGLVVWHEGAPLFCADAVADPVTGLTAAAACLDALADGGRWMLDVSMGAVSAALSGPSPAEPGPAAVADPRARDAVAAAPALGADTADVVAELGLESPGG
jgi:crotonobetainyl-CoA:carnitine CoA-transferase CaiB-like acyl-CoA transferase